MTNTRPRQHRRDGFGWGVYDWANSAFQTTVVTVLCGPNLAAIARAAVGGSVLRLGGPLALTNTAHAIRDAQEQPV